MVPVPMKPMPVTTCVCWGSGRVQDDVESVRYVLEAQGGGNREPQRYLLITEPDHHCCFAHRRRRTFREFAGMNRDLFAAKSPRVAVHHIPVEKVESQSALRRSSLAGRAEFVGHRSDGVGRVSDHVLRHRTGRRSQSISGPRPDRSGHDRAACCRSSSGPDRAGNRNPRARLRLPTDSLLAGAIIALEVLALRFLEPSRRSTNGSDASLIDIARDIGTGSVARDFPVIFVLQLASLFASS
jgi:hypothetical protein